MIDFRSFQYYNYHQDFVRVSKYLNHFYSNYIEINECAEILGRIYGLCCIDSKISFDELLIKIQNSKNEKIVEGTLTILANDSNLKNYKKICEDGLIYFLQNYDLSDEMFHEFESLFYKDENFQYISIDLVRNIIRKLEIKKDNFRDVYFLFQWIEFFARNVNVVQSLEFANELIGKMEVLKRNEFYLSEKEIVPYLLLLLQEADESDDEALVKEVLDIQERLYKLGIEIDKLYEEYD